MSLAEYAVTVRLDPLLQAALAVYAGPQERRQPEWDKIVARYRAMPIPKGA